MELPKSKKTFDAEISDAVKKQMNVTKADGKTMQGLVNRRSREKDVFDGINPVFPELSKDADLNTAQKYAALNLLLEVESSGGTKTGLEKIGNTVGKYHIKQDKAALVDPRIKKMSSSQFKKYIKNNPDKEEELVSSYLDVEINKMLDRTGVDRSQLNPNEYAAVVSNLYNKGNQPELLKNTAKLTQFRQKAFPKTAEKTQNINQDEPIQDVGENIPMEEQGIERFKTKKSTDELDLFPVERVEDIPDKPKRSFLGFEFNEGGAVPMQKQMEMFDDGGLMDEGGTVDPVSGNDVPPGSTQEEVRDDIPAQLSEGEFVFPADVVRYIGLGNLMQIRQEAKMGLKMMDKMGQMGNSDEATMPDDLPFDINDLDMEEEDEYNTRQEFAVGGMPTPNPNTGVYYNPAATAPTTGVAAVPQQAASQQYVQPVRPQQAAVPTMQAYKPSEIPTFTQTIGSTPGQYDELREYKNESGEVRQIPFKAGQPIYPIPEGFTYVDPEATKTEEVTTTPTDVKTQTTRVREEGGDGVDQGGAFGTDGIQETIGNMKERYSITGSRGIKMPSIISALFGGDGAIGSTDPATITNPNEDAAISKVRSNYEKLLGTTITGYVGTQKGDLDPVTGGVFDSRGRAINEDGTSAVGPGGTRSYATFADFRADRAAGKESGWSGGFIDSDTYDKLSQTGKNNYDKYVSLTRGTEDSGKQVAPSVTKPSAKVPDYMKVGSNMLQGLGEPAGPPNRVDPGLMAAVKAQADRLDAGDKTGGYAQSGSTSGDETQQTVSPPTKAEDFGAMSPEDFGTSGDETPQTSQDVQDDYGYGSDFGFNEGGLASKPKPKAKKKMKKGGLASKK